MVSQTVSRCRLRSVEGARLGLLLGNAYDTKTWRARMRYENDLQRDDGCFGFVSPFLLLLGFGTRLS